MLFFQIGKLLELISMSRTRKSIEKFMDIRPQYANLKISGGEMQVPPEDLNPRQVIIIKPGERIPVDAIVTQGSSTLDTKALTGESEPRRVKKMCIRDSCCSMSDRCGQLSFVSDHSSG